MTPLVVNLFVIVANEKLADMIFPRNTNWVSLVNTRVLNFYSNSNTKNVLTSRYGTNELPKSILYE